MYIMKSQSKATRDYGVLESFALIPCILRVALFFSPTASETNHLLVNAQVPISIFVADPDGEISKSKMSIGRPSVMQAFGI